MLSTKKALSILYALTSILILVGIEPFRTAGLFLSIFYLPGFFLFAIGKREALNFEDFFLSFPVSIGISSVFSSGLMIAGLNVNHVLVSVHIFTGIVLAIYLFVIRNRNNAVILNTMEIKFCLFALIMVLIFSIPIFVGPNRIAVASHAFFHSSIINQVLNGIFPPDNPGLGGIRVGFYWGFHSLIAVIAALSDFHQIQLVFAANILSLYMVFGVSYSVARLFGLSEGYRYLMPLVVVGLMRADAGLFFLANLISNNMPSAADTIAQPWEPYDYLTAWIQGIPLLDSRMFFLNKYYNVSGMTLAIFLILSYFMHLFILLKNNLEDSKVYLVSMGIVIAACFFIYPPLAIIIMIHGPVWVLYTFFSAGGSFKDRAVTAFVITLPYIAALVIVVPYLLLVTQSFSGGQSKVLQLDFYTQSLKNLAVFLLPFPVIVYGLRAVVKYTGLSRELYLLLISTALCFGLSVFTRVYFDNSYKFNYILTFFFAFFFVFALSVWMPRLKDQWLKRFVATAIILFLMLTPFTVIASYVVSSLSTEYVYTFSKGHMVYRQDKDRNQAYAWIRDNTPQDSLIMLSYIETNWPCCGLNSNYEAAALSERSQFVVKDSDFTERNPEFKERIHYRERLFTEPGDPKVIEYFSSLNRPLYLLLEKDLSYRFVVEDRFKDFPEIHREDFQLVFSNDRQRIYLLKQSLSSLK